MALHSYESARRTGSSLLNTLSPVWLVEIDPVPIKNDQGIHIFTCSTGPGNDFMVASHLEIREFSEIKSWKNFDEKVKENEICVQMSYGYGM